MKERLANGTWAPVDNDVESYENKSHIARFQSKLLLDNQTGCLLWKGGCSHDGYGKFQIGTSRKKHTIRSHRFALAIKLKRWPKGFALHNCDVITCCNPEHLYEGTQKQNINDVYTRDRHSRTVLNHKDRLLALKDYHNGETIADLARKYNVRYQSIYNLVKVSKRVLNES